MAKWWDTEQNFELRDGNCVWEIIRVATFTSASFNAEYIVFTGLHQTLGGGSSVLSLLLLNQQATPTF